MSSTHNKTDNGFVRSEAYYDKLMKKFCGTDYKSHLRVIKRQEVRQLLKKPTKDKPVTCLVHGVKHDIRCFMTEAFNLVVRNGLSAVKTDDSMLVKLNFNDVNEIPDTTVEDVTELERVDFLWLDICTTKNNYIPHQIIRLIDHRDQAGKRTIISSPERNDKLWQARYESANFISYLEGLDHMKIQGYK